MDVFSIWVSNAFLLVFGGFPDSTRSTSNPSGSTLRPRRPRRPQSAPRRKEFGIGTVLPGSIHGDDETGVFGSFEHRYFMVDDARHRSRCKVRTHGAAVIPAEAGPRFVFHALNARAFPRGEKV